VPTLATYHRLVIEVTIILPLVPRIVAIVMMVIYQLSLEEEETSVRRGPAVE
jgi:hypothetical protein